MVKPPDSDSEYRYERKFCTSNLTIREMECVLRHHAALFFEPYPARWVNSCYLETQDMAGYRDNIDGVHDRVKTRLRWYGELFGAVPSPMLELKIKSGSLGRKSRFPVAGFSLDPGFCRQSLQTVLRQSQLPMDVDMHVRGLSPVLVNRYWRKYFESADRKCRVTLDTHLRYYAVGPLKNAFALTLAETGRLVVELKYSPQDERFAAAIATRFPVGLSRNSKFANGVGALYADL